MEARAFRDVHSPSRIWRGMAALQVLDDGLAKGQRFVIIGQR
jgi:hypothetical protein